MDGSRELFPFDPLLIMTHVTVQIFEDFKKSLNNELTTLRTEFVNLPEFLQYREQLEISENNYRKTADADIKKLIQDVRAQFQIESTGINEKMEQVMIENTTRSDVLTGAASALEAKVDSVAQRLQFPRPGDQALQSKQLEMQSQINELLIRIQALTQQVSRARPQDGRQDERRQHFKRSLIDPKFLKVPDLTNDMPSPRGIQSLEEDIRELC